MFKSPKILIVDDEKELCELIELILKDESYQIDCAHTLREAKKKWIEKRHSVVILDCQLPDGSGLDLITELESMLITSKVIMITGKSNLSKGRAEAMGVEFFIQKPFSLKMIRELVQEIIMVQEN